MKRSCAVILGMLLCLHAAASPVDTLQAARMARAFWSGRTVAKSASALSRTEWSFDEIYLFTHPAGGFVLVSGNDAAMPVLGYSISDSIDPDNLPDGLEALLTDWQRQLSAIGQGKRDARWDNLPPDQRSKDATVGPLVTALWYQKEPYNDSCPASGTERAVTGCAATAQAMLLHYWKFPAIGMGSHSYTCTNYGLQEARPGHTVYRWDLMPDELTSASPAEQRASVAQLMYQIGVTNELAYGTVAQGGTGGVGLQDELRSPSQNNSLLRFFHFKPTMRVISREGNYTDSQWRDTLIAELDHHRPILYGSTDNAGGHAFVCDGYDRQGWLHFNFGWAGMGNGFFPVEHISPTVNGENYGDYDRNTTALLGAEPVDGPIVGDTMLLFDRRGGTDSVLFAGSQWSLATDAAWISIGGTDFDSVGWVKVTVDENTTGDERVALLTFTQGPMSTTVRVVQAYHDTGDYCPLTVEMSSTGYPGWLKGAYLTVESAGGRIYAELALSKNNGTHATEEVRVAPSATRIVFHSTGTTDRFIDYTVLNHYGEPLVEVHNAYEGGGTHLVAAPCSHVGIDDVGTEAPRVRTAQGQVIVDGVAAGEVSLLDIQGRLIATKQAGGTTMHFDVPASGTYLIQAGRHAARKVTVIR